MHAQCNSGMSEIHALQSECEYSPEPTDDGKHPITGMPVNDSVDALIAYKDALESRLAEAAGSPARREESPPGVRAYVELSTAHTAAGELARLACLGAHDGPRRLVYEYGCWVNVPTEAENAACEESLADIAELCPNVVACLRFAHCLGCWWVQFDADAPAVESLPQFDWESEAGPEEIGDGHASGQRVSQRSSHGELGGRSDG